MAKRKESLKEALDRLTEKARPLRDVLEDVIVTRPGLSHHVAGCHMTDEDKLIAREVVVIWMKLATMAFDQFRLIALHDGQTPMEAERGIRAIDEILERLPAGLKDMAPQFHQWRDTLTMVKPWPPEVKQKELAVLNKILDCMQPFEGVVNAVARYCLKLQGAQLGIERVYDHAENIQFGREIRTELDLME